MKLSSIQFRGKMIPLVASGRKTNTRRVIKDQGLLDRYTRVDVCYRCPYGAPGDTLWVKESMREDADGVWVYESDGEPVGCDRDDESAMIAWVHHKNTGYQPAMFIKPS